MGWSEFTDEAMPPADTPRTCWQCNQNGVQGVSIAPGTPYITRRGKFDGEQKGVYLHATAECAGAAYAGDAAESAAATDDADDAVTSPPETTPLATVADEKAAAAKRAADDEAAAAAAGELTPSQRQRLEHLAVIKAKGDEADVAYANWCDAAATAKELKKVYEGRMGELRSIIRNGSAQTRLDFGHADDDDEPTPAKDPATAAEQPEWMSRPLSVLKLPESLVAKLAEGAIETLGHLKAFWDAGRVLNDLKGIGSEKAARVADAWANYAKEHPEVWGADGAPDDEDAHDPFSGDAPSEDAVTDDGDSADEAGEEDDPFADDPEFEAAGDDAAA